MASLCHGFNRLKMDRYNCFEDSAFSCALVILLNAEFLRIQYISFRKLGKRAFKNKATKEASTDSEPPVKFSILCIEDKQILKRMRSRKHECNNYYEDTAAAIFGLRRIWNCRRKKRPIWSESNFRIALWMPLQDRKSAQEQAGTVGAFLVKLEIAL